MNIELLKTFITLSNVKNFTKTAQLHCIVQSTVSNRIKELENSIGKKLFIRNNNDIELTPAGEILLKYAYKIVSIEDELISKIKELDNPINKLHIGTVNAIYDCYLHKFIPGFLKNYPDINVSITNTTSSNLINMINNNSIDIAFSYEPLYNTQYQCLPFKEDKFVLVTSPKNNIYPNGITNYEILNLPMVYTDFFYLDLSFWFNSLFPENYNFKYKVSNASRGIDILVSGVGYSFLPYSYVEKQLNEGSLITIDLLETVPLSLRSYIITKNKNKNNINATTTLFLNQIIK